VRHTSRTFTSEAASRCGAGWTPGRPARLLRALVERYRAPHCRAHPRRRCGRQRTRGSRLAYQRGQLPSPGGKRPGVRLHGGRRARPDRRYQARSHELLREHPHSRLPGRSGAGPTRLERGEHLDGGRTDSAPTCFSDVGHRERRALRHAGDRVIGARNGPGSAPMERPTSDS